MRRARRRENGLPTPATNRARIVGLEEEIERLARLEATGNQGLPE
jgi:hypothetical protein